MSERVDVWLAGRKPEPPEPLTRYLGELGLGALDGEASSADYGASEAERMTRRLADEALAALDRARQSPGRVRESAFHLLAGDALLTYACEAALETDSPEDALTSLLTRTAAQER